MPIPLAFLCYLIAIILFVIAGVWNPSPPPRYSLVAFGLAFFAAGHLLA